MLAGNNPSEAPAPFRSSAASNGTRTPFSPPLPVTSEKPVEFTMAKGFSLNRVGIRVVRGVTLRASHADVPGTRCSLRLQRVMEPERGPTTHACRNKAIASALEGGFVGSGSFPVTQQCHMPSPFGLSHICRVRRQIDTLRPQGEHMVGRVIEGDTLHVLHMFQYR